MQYETVIGVLTYRRYDLLEECVKSVLETTDFSKSILIIVNNSTDEEYIDKVNNLAKETHLPVINFRLNRGTSAAWNAIARMYDCRQISILNDDMRLYPRWQDAMNYVLQYPKIGMISLTQELGVDSWKNFKNTVSPNQLNIQKDIFLHYPIYPAGSHVMIRKDVFDDVGGFDENFWLGLEEVDFSIRAINKGYYQAIVMNKLNYAFAVHYGSGTDYRYIGDDNSLEYFEKKHGAPWPMPDEFQQKLHQLIDRKR